MGEEYASCAGPFGGAKIEYPVQFDLRIIYEVAAAGDLQATLETTLATAGIPCSMIQGIVKPQARYGRMGARVTIASKAVMDLLYARVSALPGVKAVI